MKTRLFGPAVVLASGLAINVIGFAQAPRIDIPAPSPACTLKQRVGFTDIEINYSRPGLKGRVVVGNIDPFGQVWRAGANAATQITFSTPVKLNGTEIPAGTYGLFAIPDKEEWTVIFNKTAKQWGAYKYDAKDDVLRVKAAPIALSQPVETFTIDVNDIRDDSATLNLIWADWRVPVKINVDVTAKVLAEIDAAMTADGKKPYAEAAMFYINHDLDLKKAAGWMDAALAEQPNAFWLFYHKARLLAKMGDKAGAIAAAHASIDLVSKETGPEKGEYTRLNEALIASMQ
jgi:Protein of unknown function (DUF2911)